MELLNLKIPLLLNFSQCKLLEKDYYAVIEHCSEVIKHEPGLYRYHFMENFVKNRLVFADNVKALYRRAKAHVGAWNPDDARKDYQRCMELDKSLIAKVNRELDALNEEIKLNDIEQKMKLKKIFS